jgi:kynurenine formamidase
MPIFKGSQDLLASIVRLEIRPVLHGFELVTNYVKIVDWCDRGGIVGRGVLLDYIGYIEAKGLPLPDPCRTIGITVKDLDAVIEYQNVSVTTGDILFIRTGFVRWYNNAPDNELYRKLGGETSTYIGVQGSEEMKEWLWNHHFAALASDTFAFEMRPHGPCSLHSVVLPLWGTPLGELFNLERCAEYCKRYQRWSFFVTSAPLNIPNGVASPPNIIAVF